MNSHPIKSLILLAVSMLVFVACNSKPDNLQLIPEDANLVVTADLRSMAIKASLSDVMKMPLFETLDKELRAENRNLSMLMDDLKKNPTSTGITFDDGLAYWLMIRNEKELYQCMSMSLSSRKKFEKTARTLFSNLTPENKVFLSEDIYFMKSGWNSMIAWDNEKAVVISAISPYSEVKMKKALAAMFKSEKNIIDNADYNRFMKKKEDISLWVNMDVINKVPELKQVYEQMGDEYFDYFNDTYFHAHLTFEKDKINFDFELKPGEQLKALYEKEMYLKKFNQNLLKKLPSGNYVSMSFALNMPLYYDVMMKTNMQLSSLDSLFTVSTGVELKPLMESLNGSVVMSLYDFNPMPRLAIVFDLNNNNLMKKLMEKIPNYMTNGEIQIIKAGEMAFYIYCGKDFCIAANDESLIQSAALGENVSPALFDNKTGKNMAENPVYMNIDLNFNQYPGFIADQLRAPGTASITLNMIDSYASNLEIKSIDSYHTNMILNTENKNKNSLFSLISLINEYYQQFTNL